jgi:3-dehydroquinate dehydratase II
MVEKIHIINGPNLNLLGKREPAVYGSVSFDSYFDKLKADYPDVKLQYMQTNHEGVIIDLLHQYGFEPGTGIILNAGGLSHTSIALRDAVASVQTPVVEVHISDIYKRESFRWHSYLTEVCAVHFTGHGLDGYRMALEYLVKKED